MMRMMVAGLALGLTACGGAGNEQPSAVNQTDVTANQVDYQQRVAELPEGQVNVVLLRAILDADQPCQGVTSSERQPDQEGKQLWLAHCTGGSDWVVAIGQDGNAAVTGPVAARPAAAGQQPTPAQPTTR